MDPYQNHDFPWKPYPDLTPPNHSKRRDPSVKRGILICLVCFIVVLSVLLTYTLTSSYERSMYQQKLMQQERVIEDLRAALANGGGTEFQKLQFISFLFERYSYYSDSMDREAAIDAVLKAYAEATGDDYAEYYTDEEYAALMADSSGNSVGVGITVVQDELTVNSYTYQTFPIIAVYQNSPAEKAGLLIGDCIVAIQKDGAYRTIAELGGYSAALAEIKGDAGTVVELMVFRKDENGAYVQKTFSITREAIVKQSVSYKISVTDPTVGIVHLSEFDMTTPTQFKSAVKDLQSKGVQKFVFDVRNNPGGDLQSIKAVLSFLLEAGDLVLSAVDNKGNIPHSYRVEEQILTGSYASCSVKKEEIGMFRDLDMVVLCNENTASAAEVFTAALRDHKNTPIVGLTTFGKGIMQGYFSLSDASYGVFDGWIKMTTYAYVTECGVPYHGVGIKPTREVSLSEEAQKINIYLLPEEKDDQLLAAIDQVNK